MPKLTKVARVIKLIVSFCKWKQNKNKLEFFIWLIWSLKSWNFRFKELQIVAKGSKRLLFYQSYDSGSPYQDLCTCYFQKWDKSKNGRRGSYVLENWRRSLYYFELTMVCACKVHSKLQQTESQTCKQDLVDQVKKIRFKNVLVRNQNFQQREYR